MTKKPVSETESRQRLVQEAVGLCTMSGAVPSDTFNELIQRFVSGEMSLEHIREAVILNAKMQVAGNMEQLDETGTYSQRS